MKRLPLEHILSAWTHTEQIQPGKIRFENPKTGKGADPHRARYHSSVMDVENLHSKQEFKELPDTYTIFK